MKVPTLTMDTSCVMSLINLPEDSTPINEIDALENLFQWSLKKTIKISISEKTRTEAIINISKAKEIDSQNSERIEKWIKTLEILKSYESLKGRWILGISRLGVDTVLGSEEENEQWKRMSDVLFGKPLSSLHEGDAFDLAILFEHYVNKNDYFVTRDTKNNMLKKKLELNRIWNIKVTNPIEIVAILENHLS